MINPKQFTTGRRQGGFTMVELAIVLVIVGIILAAVLKGTDMINKAKIERMTADLRGLQGMILEGEKRTGFLPGDCNHDGVIGYVTPPATVQTGTTGALAYSNEPNPDTAGDCWTGSPDEDNANTAWGDMRKANIVDPTRTNIDLARHTLSDFYAIGSFEVNGEEFNAITVYGIPLWLAKGLDVALDGPQAKQDDIHKGGARGRLRLYVDGEATHENGDPWNTAEALGGDYQLVSVRYQFDTRMSQPAL